MVQPNLRFNICGQPPLVSQRSSFSSCGITSFPISALSSHVSTIFDEDIADTNGQGNTVDFPLGLNPEECKVAFIRALVSSALCVVLSECTSWLGIPISLLTGGILKGILFIRVWAFSGRNRKVFAFLLFQAIVSGKPSGQGASGLENPDLGVGRDGGVPLKPENFWTSPKVRVGGPVSTLAWAL